MRVVFVVGAGAAMGYYPFEAWALFTSAEEARRHADAAAYLFEVFALPVYERYEETPPALRPDRWRPFGLSLGEMARDEVALAAEAVATGQATRADTGSVYAVGDFDSTQLPEVRLLFAREVDAQQYLDVSRVAGTGMQWMDVMSVYASYDECPPRARYAEPGRALSQHVLPR